MSAFNVLTRIQHALFFVGIAILDFLVVAAILFVIFASYQM